jgi:hypothetical protein
MSDCVYGAGALGIYIFPLPLNFEVFILIETLSPARPRDAYMLVIAVPVEVIIRVSPALSHNTGISGKARE